jgi:hypothetical protein
MAVGVKAANKHPWRTTHAQARHAKVQQGSHNGFL